MSGHDSAVQSLAFHSMCSKLCGGSSKGVVKIWDLQSAARALEDLSFNVSHKQQF